MDPTPLIRPVAVSDVLTRGARPTAPAPPKVCWAAVRHSSETGRQWIDVGSIDLLPEIARMNARQVDVTIPGWKRHNRVVRIVQVEIREIAAPETGSRTRPEWPADDAAQPVTRQSTTTSVV